MGKSTGFQTRGRIFNSILILCVAISMFFWVPHVDSFNVGKQTILALGSFTILSYQFVNLKLFSKEKDPFVILISIWIFLLLVLVIIAPSRQLAFFGPPGRLTGALTYISLAIMALSVYFLANRVKAQSIFVALSILGILQTLYNVIQILEIDPISWNNPYGLVIGTLGNSDFTISLTAICAISTTWLFIQAKNVKSKIGFLIAIATETYVIFVSEVRQGLVLLFIGIFGIYIIKALQKNKLYAISACLFLSLIGLISLMGGLQKGPFANLIYKESITLRGDYWRTAINMFLEKPLIGVGLGHYGQAFTNFRDQIQANRRGPAFVTDQAHNVPLEFLATGGALLLICYFAIVIYAASRLLIKVRQTGFNENQNLIVLGLIWTLYFLQSLISIDQIGLAIWGWLLLGFIAGTASKNGENVSLKKSTAMRKLLTVTILTPLFFVVVIQWNANTLLKSAYLVESNSPDANLDRLNFLRKITDYEILESSYLSESARILLSNNQVEGVDFARLALEKNPDDLNAVKYLVIYAKINKDDDLLLKYVPELRRLDPYSDLIR